MRPTGNGETGSPNRLERTAQFPTLPASTAWCGGDRRSLAAARDGKTVPDEPGTGRLEAFSDGVFAIAMTLLVLELRTPLPGTLPAGTPLRAALEQQWPAYLAFATSFATILIIWVNHHALFRLIGRVDRALLFLNGLLLFTVTVIPFPTNLVAEYLREPEARTAAVVYAGSCLAMAIAFNRLWRYAAQDGRLLAPEVDFAVIQTITAQFRFGPASYVVCMAVAGLNGVAGFALIMGLAVYWALPEWRRPGPGGG
jgi:uncharacterized membrane protein